MRSPCFDQSPRYRSSLCCSIRPTTFPFASRSWIATPTREELEAHQRFLAREESAIAEKLRQLVRPRIGEYHAAKVQVMVRDGHAAEIIAAVGSEMAAKLIVVGTKGRPETLGSVAERVVRTARRPVLVIPA